MDVTARLPAVQQSVLERDIMSSPHQLSVRMIAGALHLSAVELAAQSAVRGIARAHRRPVGPSVHGTGAMLRAVGASVAAPTVVPEQHTAARQGTAMSRPRTTPGPRRTRSVFQSHFAHRCRPGRRCPHLPRRRICPPPSSAHVHRRPASDGHARDDGVREGRSDAPADPARRGSRAACTHLAAVDLTCASPIVGITRAYSWNL